jgi:hypothetical protein
MKLSVAGTTLGGVALVILISSCGTAEPRSGGASALAPSTAATQQNTNPAPSAANDVPTSCILTPAEVKQAFAEWVGPGEVTVTSTTPDICQYDLPPGSLKLNGSGKVNPAASVGKISIGRTAYANSERVRAGVGNISVTWGGATSDEVFASSSSAFKQLAPKSATSYPENRTASTGAGMITVATKGPHWYTAQILLAAGDAGYEPSMTALGEAINAKVSAGG